MFGAIRNTHENRPTPIVRMSGVDQPGPVAPRVPAPHEQEEPCHQRGVDHEVDGVPGEGNGTSAPSSFG